MATQIKQQSPIMIEIKGQIAMVLLSDGKAQKLQNGYSVGMRHTALAAADAASKIIHEAFPNLAPSPCIFKEV